MDLQMAPVDGIEATREIRARYPDVEVVALTSFGEEERVQAALEAGASGYLLKDSDADEVVAAIRAAHRGELQIDPAVARGLMSSLAAAPQGDPTEELTPRELEVLRLVGRRARPTRRSPRSWRSASEPPGPTCRTSSASSASAHAPRQPSGRFARARGLPGLSTRRPPAPPGVVLAYRKTVARALAARGARRGCSPEWNPQSR